MHLLLIIAELGGQLPNNNNNKLQSSKITF